MEWLSTGEMIQKLKIGEKAEGKKETRLGTFMTPVQVEKEDDGAIRFVDGTGQCFPLNEFNMALEWRILPNYVSFGEAMEAHEKGITVTYHHEEYDEQFKYKFKNGDVSQFEQLYNDSIELEELIKGKWTIEEESQ